MFPTNPHQNIHSGELFMFDRLFFEADLPKDKLPKEIRDQDMSELEFQTSDLNRQMDTWSVSTAGELFLHEVEKNFVKSAESAEGFFIEEKPQGIKKIEETKSICFYRVFETEEKDYWISFDALFHKGTLLLVDVKEINEINKEEREEAQARAKEFVENRIEEQKRKTYFLFKPFKLIIGLCLIALHWLGRNLSQIHSKL